MKGTRTQERWSHWLPFGSGDFFFSIFTYFCHSLSCSCSFVVDWYCDLWTVNDHALMSRTQEAVVDVSPSSLQISRLPKIYYFKSWRWIWCNLFLHMYKICPALWVFVLWTKPSCCMWSVRDFCVCLLLIYVAIYVRYWGWWQVEGVNEFDSALDLVLILSPVPSRQLFVQWCSKNNVSC
jgi:hypothetical protein